MKSLSQQGGQGVFPFAPFSEKQEKGWLNSTPVSKKAYSDPVREEFSSAVSADHKPMVVRKWRSQIDEPFRYQVFPGYLHIELAGIVPIVKEIEKIIKREGIATSEEAEEFSVLLRSSLKEYRSVIENTLQRGSGEITETSNPLVAYLQLRDKRDITDISETLRYAICAVFPRRKEYFIDFMEKHMEELMTVRVVRKFKVFKE